MASKNTSYGIIRHIPSRVRARGAGEFKRRSFDLWEDHSSSPLGQHQRCQIAVVANTEQCYDPKEENILHRAQGKTVDKASILFVAK